MRSRRLLGPLAALLIAGAAFTAAADKRKTDPQPAGAAPIPDSRRALHALNRLTFGPRPAEAERVQAIGVDRWIEQQLHPGSIDDAALEQRLQPLRTLAMDPRELLTMFPPPFVLKAVADGRAPMPSDATRRAIYETQLAAYRMRKNAKSAQPGDPAGDDPPGARRELRTAARNHAEQLLALPPEKRLAAILRLAPEERAVLARALSPAERERLLAGMPAEDREAVLAMADPRAVVAGEMQSAKILRALYSERQLAEVMTDFWFNHFNVYDKKGPDAYLIGEYERAVIRPHALGRFEDLLLATAKSPAMLFYLDNWQSVGPNSPFARYAGSGAQGFRGRMRRRGRFLGDNGEPPTMVLNDPDQQTVQQARARRTGLNENYARELMELHTLGVDGGYTQQDVTELAKVLTGWTIRQPRLGGGFQFNDRFHEPGAKTVLGHRFSGGGEREGEEALKMLARHPATARFISRKLAMRFVSDDPPAALVARMSQAFLQTGGDITQVLRTLFRSPEFWSQQSYRAKVKTPFEFVISSLRATGAGVADPIVIAQALNKMGMPLYGMQPPTGYSMKAEAWVNSAALLNRMNFALAFVAGRLPGVAFDGAQLAGGASTPAATLAALEERLLAGDVSPQTHATLQKRLSDPQLAGAALGSADGVNSGIIAGLILGSPEFQRK